MLKLDSQTLPEAYGDAGPDEVERLQMLLGTLESTGWVKLKIAKAKPFQTFGDRNPALELLCFDALAAWSGFVSRHEAWVRRFVRAMGEDPALIAIDVGGQREALMEYLLRSPMPALEGMEFSEAAHALAELHRRCRSGRGDYLRHVSAQVFQGRSKILDAREELLRILGAEPGQFLESPVQLLVDISDAHIDEVLFIENLVTFEAMCDGRRPGCIWERSALVYAAGFKSGARRLRHRNGSRLYWRGLAADTGGAHLKESVISQRQRFEAWLYDATAVDTSVGFFGDLDFAGMSILASLRTGFSDCQAWQPGYAALLTQLQSGQGHSPADADKAGQVDPEFTGCRYADEELLPAMRMRNAFVDQEAWRVH